MSNDDVAFMEEFKIGQLEVERGTTILLEGSNSPQLYTVYRGMGLRHKSLLDGRRQILNFVFPGDFIGLQAALMSEMLHSVEAATHMSLCVFDRKSIWRLFRDQPSRALDLSWLAARSEHFLGDALASVGQKSAEERVAWALFKFWNRCLALNLVKDDACPMPFRQQDLADALGLSLVHTNKTLARLRERQLAHWSAGKLRINDVDRLAKIGLVDDARSEQRPLL